MRTKQKDMTRPTVYPESSALITPRDYHDVNPGDAIVLTAFLNGWHDNPAEATYRIEWKAPSTWDAEALRDLIHTVLATAGLPASAHEDYQGQQLAYCSISQGLVINTAGGGEREIYRRHWFFSFTAAAGRFNVALPIFPADALVVMLADPTHVASVDFRFFREEPRSDVYVPHGPAPRRVPRVKPSSRRRKGGKR